MSVLKLWFLSYSELYSCVWSSDFLVFLWLHREHFYGVFCANPPLNTNILDFYCSHDILAPWEIVAKTKQCPTLHCYVRCQAYCCVPPQTLMKVSCESGRGIRAKIQTFRLSPKLARGSLGDCEVWVVWGRKGELGREPERLYLDPDPPSTLTANLH